MFEGEIVVVGPGFKFMFCHANVCFCVVVLGGDCDFVNQVVWHAPASGQVVIFRQLQIFSGGLLLALSSLELWHLMMLAMLFTDAAVADFSGVFVKYFV